MALRELEHCRISPAPAPASSRRPSLPFTFLDIPWLHLPAVERLFFYNLPISTSHFIESQLPNLKSSLSITLDQFYPLAGTARRRPSDGRFEIHCSDEDSVPLEVSEFLDVDFRDVSGRHPRSLDKLLPLIPHLPTSPEAQPLLAVKVTIFPSQGLCLAFKVHHVACDGFSSTHFIKSWAAACRIAVCGGGSPTPPPPSLDRSVISAPDSLYWKVAEDHEILQKKEIRQQIHRNVAPPAVGRSSSSCMMSATFTVAAEHVRRLKQRLHDKATEEGKPCSHCSTFSVSCAYAWVCVVKSRPQAADDVEARLFFAVDSRRRIRPTIPAHYFGNCLGSACFVRARAGELTGKDGVLVAGEAIGKEIEALEGADVYAEAAGIFPKIMEAIPHQPVTVAGSPRLRIYETDFGWGKPEKVEVTSIRETGAISMAESRDDEGGVEIGIILPVDQIGKYAKHFSSDF
ncbi:Phenolic glucoside malonyltransferase 2 [Apostasia shenzhenica]|uniref:Phenolic glucoside malonyltransferase 2 n=1 Tax=Apostasia shenzhenica TaxID=1088818 RepID=A0A2I0BF85_9ASPA|nr:Phenolic glucoside malonyltransferase 2 [Apostasia shenzhenica]